MSVLIAFLSGAAQLAGADAATTVIARHQELRGKPEERRCLGADATTCLASLGFYVYISSRPGNTAMSLQLPGPVQQDIHSKPISQMVSFLVTFDPNEHSSVGPNVISGSLFLGDGQHVSRVEFDLPRQPIAARTSEEWASTRVFELATATLGAGCIGSDRLAFYRRYDEVQHQSASSPTADDSYSDPGVSSGLYGHTMICNVQMETTASSGVSASLGTWSSSMLSFSR